VKPWWYDCFRAGNPVPARLLSRMTVSGCRACHRIVVGECDRGPWGTLSGPGQMIRPADAVRCEATGGLHQVPDDVRPDDDPVGEITRRTRAPGRVNGRCPDG